MSVIRSGGPADKNPHNPKYEPGSLRDLAAHLRLSTSEFQELAKRVGVRRADTRRRLDQIGTVRARREIEAIESRRAERRDEWIAAGNGPSEQRWWESVGIGDTKGAISWRSADFNPSEASSWRTHEVDSPAVAAQLRDAGVEPGDLYPFTKNGTSVSAAVRWLLSGLSDHSVWNDRAEWGRAGFHPEAAVRWSELGATPKQANALRQHLPIDEAATFISGPGSISRLIDLIRSGARSEWLAGWLRSDLSIEQAAKWDRADIEPQEASVWLKAGIGSPGTAANWIKISSDPTDVEGWLQAGVKFPKTASRWIAEGFGPEQAGSWLAAGVDNPTNARVIESRLPIDLAAALTSAGFSSVEIAQWCKDRVALRWLRLMVEQLTLDPAMSKRWHRLEIPILEWPQWMEHLFDHPERVVAWRAAGLDPSKLWSEAGQGRRRFLQLGDARASVNATESSKPVQQRGSASAERPDAYETWRAEGDYWIRAANLRGRGGPFLRGLFAAGRRWMSTDEAATGGWPSVSGDWLDDAAAHAYAVRDHLRIAPIWPIVFESDALTIELAVVDSQAIAWVERDHRGLVISFDTLSFETWLLESSHAARFACGVAIHWFVDCCISLRPDRSHPHFLTSRIELSASGEAGAGEVIRYTPTPAFQKHVREVRAGTSTPPRAHHVAGFVRHLPDGWQPTAESLANAPAHVRRTMTGNETFVRDHTRGNDAAMVQVVRRLGTHSSLADALGQLGVQ